MESSYEGFDEEQNRPPVTTNPTKLNSSQSKIEQQQQDEASATNNESSAFSPSQDHQHVFLFDFGCLVCWGCTIAEEKNIVQRLEHLIENTLPTSQDDDMTYIYSSDYRGRSLSSSTRWKGDEVSLSSSSPVEKFAISLAFAQSVKLTQYEENVNKVIDESRIFPETLAKSGEILLTQRQVSKKIGELFIVRYQIFLESEMLDTPEFFWESDEWEPTYFKARKYLDIEKRMDVLRQRLGVVRELLDMLANALDNQHANRLEWIIVILIVAEVFCQILFGIVDFKCWAVCPTTGNGGSLTEM